MAEVKTKGKSKYVGQVLKDFEILDYYPATDHHNAKFKAKCLKCGNIMVRSKSCFLEENSRICCPCQRKYSLHGESRSRLYTIWQDMKRRCSKNNNGKWAYLYSGKGIKVCKEWQGVNGFENFKEWALSHGYSDDLSIDRINSNGDYDPSNCKWSTHREQNLNTSRTHYATINGETKPSIIWCEELKISHGTYRHRIERGWTEEEALLTPPYGRKKRNENG